MYDDDIIPWKRWDFDLVLRFKNSVTYLRQGVKAIRVVLVIRGQDFTTDIQNYTDGKKRQCPVTRETMIG